MNIGKQQYEVIITPHEDPVPRPSKRRGSRWFLFASWMLLMGIVWQSAVWNTISFGTDTLRWLWWAAILLSQILAWTLASVGMKDNNA